MSSPKYNAEEIFGVLDNMIEEGQRLAVVREDKARRWKHAAYGARIYALVWGVVTGAAGASALLDAQLLDKQFAAIVLFGGGIVAAISSGFPLEERAEKQFLSAESWRRLAEDARLCRSVELTDDLTQFEHLRDARSALEKADRVIRSAP